MGISRSLKVCLTVVLELEHTEVAAGFRILRWIKVVAGTGTWV